MLVPGCLWGSDDPTPEAAVVEDGENGGGDGGTVSATVQVDGETHEFDSAGACTTDGMVAIQFEDGEDWVSLNVAGDVILVRMLSERRSGSTSAHPIRRRCRGTRCRGRARGRPMVNRSR